MLFLCNRKFLWIKASSSSQMEITEMLVLAYLLPNERLLEKHLEPILSLPSNHSGNWQAL